MPEKEKTHEISLGGMNNPQDIIRYALESDEVEKIYANGFINFLNISDVGIILQLNNKPKVVLNISYSLAKTLHEKLGDLIKNFEEDSQHEIMTTDFIKKSVTKKNQSNSK